VCHAEVSFHTIAWEATGRRANTINTAEVGRFPDGARYIRPNTDGASAERYHGALAAARTVGGKGNVPWRRCAAIDAGHIVGQLAKQEGLKVIGSVGSDDKLEFIVKGLDFDAGFNYKKEPAYDALERLAPDGVDIYYENVGGEQLDAALKKMKYYGTIIACGMVNETLPTLSVWRVAHTDFQTKISQYKIPQEEKYSIPDPLIFIKNSLTLRGFSTIDVGMGPNWGKEHLENISKWLIEGSMKEKLHITEGIDNAARGLEVLFRGYNFGKAVLEIQEE
jgi:NADPH-dependent curcumin reductase CurA